MEYITEIRGGYDEWSDEYRSVLGLELETGDKIMSRIINDTFTDESGNKLEVELPMRANYDQKITIERYDPEYTYWDVSKNTFAEAVDPQSMTIDTTKLQN